MNSFDPAAKKLTRRTKTVCKINHAYLAK